MLRLQTYHRYSAPDSGSFCTLEGKPSFHENTAKQAGSDLEDGYDPGNRSMLIDWARICVGPKTPSFKSKGFQNSQNF
jgi:hypothetical protein